MNPARNLPQAVVQSERRAVGRVKFIQDSVRGRDGDDCETGVDVFHGKDYDLASSPPARQPLYALSNFGARGETRSLSLDERQRVMREYLRYGIQGDHEQAVRRNIGQ